MILAALVGVAVEQLTSIERAILPAVLIGMFVAMLVPTKGSCRVKLPQPEAKPEQEPARESDAQG